MTYKGPQSIPVAMAEDLIRTLNPILDLLASEPSKPKRLCWKPADRKLEENRWALWRAVMIAHEAVYCHNNFSSSTIWADSPIRRRHQHELNMNWKFVGPWWELRCGRPTKKGEPCKAPLRHGRAHCWRHSTPQENADLRLWQDRIHLPYPRVGGGEAGFDREGLIQGLQALRDGLLA